MIMSFCNAAHPQTARVILKQNIVESSSVFEQSKLHNLKVLDIHERIKHSTSSNEPPKPLRVVHPSEAGQYPLLIFFHGFYVKNVYYTSLFQHVASHGYIILAPQMYDSFTSGDATQDIDEAVKLTDWLPTRLSSYLPKRVCPNFEMVAVAGHSRGGKVAFGAALGRGRSGLPSSVKYSAIIGVDPVDGEGRDNQTLPKILSFKANSFRQGVPALVIGSGAPNQSMSPDGVNHRNFFEECCAPAYHFGVKNCEHSDFLDDGFPDEILKFWRPNAKKRIRSFAGGMMVAFLKGCFNDDYFDLKVVVANPSAAPLEIEPPQACLDEKDKAGISSRL